MQRLAQGCLGNDPSGASRGLFKASSSHARYPAGSELDRPKNPSVDLSHDTGGISHRAAGTRAIDAQLVAATEIHWSGPCGKPLSKYGWIGIERLLTYHDPSSSC